MGDGRRLEAVLDELHDSYIWRVNCAVAEGRDDLVRVLADEYVEAALRVITSAEEAGAA